MDRKYTPEAITEVYRELTEIKQFSLPDSLWEGGLSVYKTSVGKLRQKQDRLTSMEMEIQQEYAKVNRQYFVLIKLMRAETERALTDPDVKIERSIWAKRKKADQKVQAKYGNDIDDVKVYLEEVCGLKEAVHLIYSDLSRGRTDLKIQVRLLEMEAGANGMLNHPPIGTQGISKKQVDDSEWNKLKDKKEESR